MIDNILNQLVKRQLSREVQDFNHRVWFRILFVNRKAYLNRFRCRLYAALAADEQRRVVQLSFTGCVNFSDMSDVDETVCDWGVHEIAGKWLK